MVAANGTPIEYHGQRQVRFRWCSKELEFSQAEVSRACCVDHIVRGSCEHGVCGQVDEESIEVEPEDEIEQRVPGR